MVAKSKNQLRRERAKLKKLEAATEVPKQEPFQEKNIDVLKEKDEAHIEVSVEILPELEKMDGIIENPAFAEYKKIFDKFHAYNEVDEPVAESTEKGEIIESGDEQETEANKDNVEIPFDTTYETGETDTDVATLSKRQFKRKYKIPLSVLKYEASKNPNLVEWTDADSPDPRLHIYLKTMHNAVPVPVNWSTNKSFLSSKRGYDKAQFELPKFILDTGIIDMRNTTEEDNSTLKQRMRERVQPKMGQLDIDFMKLHDAFFKYQTKPPLLRLGETYHEKMEDEAFTKKTKVSSVVKPGKLSDELKTALGMPLSDDTVLPPWASRLSVLGPPPSYPDMKVANGKIILKGELSSEKRQLLENHGNPVDKTQWGLIEEDEEEDEEDDDEETGAEDQEAADDDEEDVQQEGDVAIDFIGEDESPMVQPNGPEDEDEQPGGKPKQLYRVLKEVKSGQSSFMGSETTAYDL